MNKEVKEMTCADLIKELATKNTELIIENEALKREINDLEKKIKAIVTTDSQSENS